MILNAKSALEVLNECLKTGADYSEIYYQDAMGRTYTRKYKKNQGVDITRTRGIGIRIIKDDEVVYGYTPYITKAAMVSLARKLAEAFQGDRKKTVNKLVKKQYPVRSPIEKPFSLLNESKIFRYLLRGEKAAYSYSEEIEQVTTGLCETQEHVEIYNSDSIMTQDDRIRTRLVCNVVSKRGESLKSSYKHKGLSKGLELLDETDFEKMCLNAAKISIALQSAIDGPSGEFPVVLGAGSGGVLFHEACGHPLEGCAISNKTSPFADKMSTKIASDIVNTYDDGTIENGWGTLSVDDEGNQTTKNQLIKDGVLVSYMLDKYTAKRMGNGYKPTGSARRESYLFPPTTRMTNTYIANGISKKEDIIKSVKFGIYCEDFTGGQVNPNTDQFVFTSDTAYLIEDGKITKMIKPTTFVGYGYEILKRITMIADDGRREPGFCSSDSGSIEVETGQPTILVSKILVGGQGGQL